MDLSGISTEDLKALQSGDLSKVSTDGLKALQSGNTSAPPQQPSRLDAALDQPIPVLAGLSPRRAFNIGVGALRGAKDVVDVGAHGLASLADKVTGGSEADRIRALDKTGVDEYSAGIGSTPDAKIGRLAGQAAITAPIGGVLGQGARLLGAGPKVVNALASNGFSLGGAPATTLREAAGNLALRSGASGLDAFAQVGAVDPKSAPLAGGIGLVLPGAIKLAGLPGELMAGAPLTAGRQASVAAARDAGLVLPPTEINPNALNSAVEGLSGKIKTAQAASFKNQPVINDLAASDLGLPKGEQITKPILQDIRREAGKAYEAVKNTGTITADGTYNKVLDDAASRYKGVSHDFPGLAKSDVADLVNSMRQPKFSASGAVDAVAVLRERANEAFAQGNSAFGKAAKSIADGMENMIGRHLEETGQDPALLQAFQEARTKIAKSYSVERALNEADGTVSAKALAKQLAKGKPLSGNLETIAKAGQAFPEATQALTRNPGSVSPLDYGAAIVNAKSSVGAALAGLAVRPLARNALLSQPYQNFAAKTPSLNGLAGPAAYRALPRSVQQN